MESPEHVRTCQEMFALLSEYLDFELPPDGCQQMQAHLAGCRPCIEFVESLRETVELCRQYHPTELPAPLGEQAREQLLNAYRAAMAGRNAKP